MGISDGGVPGITLGAADRITLGGYEGFRPVLSGDPLEGARNGKTKDGSEELEYSGLGYSMG